MITLKPLGSPDQVFFISKVETCYTYRVKKLLFVFLISLLPGFVSAAEIQVLPEAIFQGDPISISLDIPVSEISSGTFLGKKLFFFTLNNNAKALVPTNLYKDLGMYPLTITLKNGISLTKNIEIQKRQTRKIVLAIPKQLGDNTPANQTKVITKLVDENKILSQAYYRHMRPLWSASFRNPLATSTITDTFGTVRDTGSYSVSHKGTDFRAGIGTDVYPVNRGVVRFAGTLPTYGKAVIVDHGLGVTSLYLHLSKVNVIVGQLVLPHKLLGKSGDTGFSGGPHLHLSVKIDGVSIDPVTFLKLY